jgi:Pyridoxamine 5'-phosphate oxidase
MHRLPEPQASPPIMFGERATSVLLPWSWAVERLSSARNYWVATVRPGGRPHCRPLWAVWLEDGLWFYTGSLAIRNLAASPEVSVNLEGGDEPLILEGVANKVTDHDALQRFVDAYNPKYSWSARPADGQIADDSGGVGPAYRVRPRLVFGWQSGMRDPTRWTFPDVSASDA